MNAVNKAHLLAAQLLAHGLENVSLADVKASLSCRTAMVAAVADLVVKIGIDEGCQEMHSGAEKALYAVIGASGMDYNQSAVLIHYVDAQINAAYDYDAAHEADMHELRKEQLEADCGGDMAEEYDEPDFDVRELVSSPVFHPA